MSDHGTTSGLYIEFQAAVLRQLPRAGKMTSEVLNRWVKNQEDLKKVLAEALLPKEEFLPDIDWVRTYVLLGYAEGYVKSPVIKEAPGFWTVPVIQGVTCNKVASVLRKLGVSVYLYKEDLDKDVTENDCDPANGSYAVSFTRTIEADEENKNLSANMLKQRGHKGITLLERLLLELGCFLTTGKHLDIKNVTLCSGSRYSDGVVPYVRWHPDYREVHVSWFRSGSAHGHLRSRSAVSLSGNPKY